MKLAAASTMIGLAMALIAGAATGQTKATGKPLILGVVAPTHHSISQEGREGAHDRDPHGQNHQHGLGQLQQLPQPE